MNRVVLPELLDGLPSTDSRAIHSREDLLRVNAWMGNPSKLAGLLSMLPGSPPAQIVELGAGDGRATLRLAALTGWRGVQYLLVDQQNLLSDSTLRAFQQLGWTASVCQMDAFEFLSSRPAPGLIIANLFLHHFKTPELTRLLKLASARRSAFAACEPLRSPAALLATRLLGLIGCNQVTRHDAFVSVRAGFQESELSALWPPGPWRLVEKRAGLFSHLFLAAPV